MNVAIIGMIFAVFGFWQLTICMIFFAIALLFGINLMTEIEEESTNYSEMISLANNVDDRDAINWQFAFIVSKYLYDILYEIFFNEA